MNENHAQEQSTREHAVEMHRHGLRVFPVRVDGSKAPSTGWSAYHNPDTPYPLELVQRWFPVNEPSGIGLILGDTADGLICFDVEYSDFAEEIDAYIIHCLPHLAGRIPIVKTPGKDSSGGRHFYFRHRGTKSIKPLAAITDVEAVRRTGSQSHTCAIELRSQGLYNLVPGGDVRQHPHCKPYEYAEGSPPVWNAPAITAEELESLVEMCRGLSHVAVSQSANKQEDRVLSPPSDGRKRPGDDFNERGSDIKEILAGHFDYVYSKNGVDFFRRKGKSVGVSASYGYSKSRAGSPLLYVFSTNAAPFEAGQSYSKFTAYAVAFHGGSFSKAARELSKKGYGEKTEFKRMSKKNSAAEGADNYRVDPSRQPKVLDFPVEIFPRAIQEYCWQVAKSIGCPVDFVGTMILPVASGAIGTTRVIEIKKGFAVYCSVYSALVARPGGGKSPAQRHVCEPVKRRAKMYKMTYEDQMAEWKEREESGEPMDSGKEPRLQRISCRNITSESLAPILTSNQRGLVIIKDEVAGFVKSMDQYRGGKGADREFFMEVWSNIDQDVDRKSQGGVPITVEDPFINVFGGVQPDKLHYVTNLMGENDGFADRFLVSYPDEVFQTAFNWEEVDEETSRKWNLVYNSLHDDFHFGQGSDERGRIIDIPMVVRCSLEAGKMYAEWYEPHRKETQEPDFPPRLIGSWLKMTEYTLRLALIIHCLRCASPDVEEAPADEFIVDEETMIRAIALAEYYKSHIARAFGFVIRNNKDRLAFRSIKYIMKQKDYTITVRKFMMNQQEIAQTATEAREIFEEMEDRGWGKLSQDGRSFTANSFKEQDEVPDVG
jgi:hypothetical protein